MKVCWSPWLPLKCVAYSSVAAFNSTVLQLSRSAKFPGVASLWAVLNLKTKSGKPSVKSLTGAEMLSYVDIAVTRWLMQCRFLSISMPALFAMHKYEIVGHCVLSIVFQGKTRLSSCP